MRSGHLSIRANTMRKKFTGLHSLPVILPAISLLSCVHAPLLYAQPDDAIGIVLSFCGDVEAQGAGGAVRVLSLRSLIVAQDTIFVGADGLAQLRMADNARLSFKPCSEFTFIDYVFDGNPA